MKKGFTLLELLIVIAIIAILAVVVFVALDPLTRFQNARNAQRWTSVEAMLDGIKLNQVDNGGDFISAVSSLTAGNFYTIGSCATGGDSGCSAKTTQSACADLSGLVTSGHLAKIPTDPSSGSSSKTDFYIMRSSTGNLTIGACDPEAGAEIEVMR